MTATDGRRVFQQYSNRALDTLGLWTQVNQTVTQQLLDLSANSTKDGVRLLAEVQASGIDAVRGNLATVTERLGAVAEEPQHNPTDWSRTSVLTGIEQVQRWFRVLEGNTQALTRYAEAVQSTAAEATSRIQEALDTVAQHVRSNTDEATETVKTAAETVKPAAAARQPHAGTKPRRPSRATHR
jgi:hypothetical protein